MMQKYGLLWALSIIFHPRKKSGIFSHCTMGHHGSGQEVEVEIIDDDQYEDDQDRAAFEEIMPGLPVEMVQFPLFVSAVSW